jgi:putative acetyltransferase
VGYRPIPAYGEYVGNPYSVCFEKHLAVLVQ